MDRGSGLSISTRKTGDITRFSGVSFLIIDFGVGQLELFASC